jgi:hypothetical protein
MACETVVIGLNWVGDNVLALPAYKALQHRFRSEGGIASPRPRRCWSDGRVQDVIPGVARPRRIGCCGATSAAVILPNSFRAAFVAFAAGIGKR